MSLLSLWNGEVSVELPEGFSTQTEPGGTVSLRFGDTGTMMRLSRTRLEGFSAGDSPGREQVRETAREHAAPTLELADTTVVTYDDTAQESDYLHGRCWLIGGGDLVVLLSCDVPEEEFNAPVRVTIHAHCDSIARSLAFAQKPKPKPEPKAKAVAPPAPPAPREVPAAPPLRPAPPKQLRPARRPPAQRQRPLTAKEEQAVARFAEKGMAMLDRYAPDHEQGVFDRLDTAVAAWIGDSAAGRPSPDKAVREFGSLLGELLNGYFESRWCATNQGTELVLYVRHDRGAMVSPLDLVRKRLATRDAGYFARIRTEFERIIAGRGEPPSKSVEDTSA